MKKNIIKSKKSNKNIKVLLIILGVFILVNVAAMFYLGVFSTRDQSPERNISRMLDRMSKVDTLRSEISFADNSFYEYKLSLLLDKGDLEDIKIEVNFLLERDLDKIEGKIKFINQVLYVFLSLDEEVGLPFDNWIRISQEDILAAEEMFTIPSEIEVKNIKNIQKIISQANIFKFEEELPCEENKMYNYLVSLDPEKTADFIIEIAKIIIPHEVEELSKKEIEEIREGIIGELIEIGGIQLNLLIGREDYLLYGLSIEKEIESQFFDEIHTTSEKTLFSFNMVNSDFNEPIVIEEPEEYIGFLEVLQSLMMMMY